ncbi:MAG: M20/M25/M40 family metallo-hydrolase, partial [Pseudomonadota bacterium]
RIEAISSAGGVVERRSHPQALDGDFRSGGFEVVRSLGLVEEAERVRDEAKRIAAEAALTAKVDPVFAFPVTAFDDDCVGAVRSAAEDLGLSHRDITSGAGHDAVYMARVAPTAMVFTPCIGGISHNEAEDMTEAWAEAGCNVLLRAVVQTAEIAGT